MWFTLMMIKLLFLRLCKEHLYIRERRETHTACEGICRFFYLNILHHSFSTPLRPLFILLNWLSSCKNSQNETEGIFFWRLHFLWLLIFATLQLKNAFIVCYKHCVHLCLVASCWAKGIWRFFLVSITYKNETSFSRRILM